MRSLQHKLVKGEESMALEAVENNQCLIPKSRTHLTSQESMIDNV